MTSLRNALAGIPQAKLAARKTAKTTPTPEPTPRERPAAKRGSPEFTQIGPYIRKSTKKAVDLRLIEETGERDLSGLVERLLTEWLAK